MGWTGRAWVVAASVGAVEALKDQGFCRWNHPIRLIHQHVKSHVGSLSQAVNYKLSSSSPSSSSAMASCKFRDERAKRTEKTMRKVMQLSSWGPN